MRTRAKYLWVVLVMTIVVVTGWRTVTPSGSGPWAQGQTSLPHAVFHGDSVAIEGFRHFAYRSADDFDVRYFTRAFDLNLIESVWYVVTPFSTDWRGPAHTFLSFGFSDSSFAAISVEARRQPDQSYSTLKGLFKQYEVIYVVGDERDLMGARLLGDDQLYAYPIKAGVQQIRQLFVDMLVRANALREQPEFYNTFTNNCTTNILDHVNRIVPEPVRYGVRILLPGYSDRVAYDRGWIDTDLSLEEARTRFHVNDRAQAVLDDPEFSTKIRRAGP